LLSKVNRISEEQIVSEITSLSMVSPDKLSPEERLRLTGLQYKSDEIYERKAEGVKVCQVKS